MCGILGYAGHRPAVPVVVEGLRRLEYRGYDSAGVAFVQSGKMETIRAEGKLATLENKLAEHPNVLATCGMGHTRWATHGVPAVRNAHPHMANDGSIAIVHNGIIENYQEIKDELLAKGYVFHSETDTEVLVNLIAECRKGEPDLLKAFAAALRLAKGAYAVCMMSVDDPSTLYAVRHSAPLLLGVGTGENFLASDIPAFLPYTREVVFLEDGEIVRMTARKYSLMRLDDLSSISRETSHISWDMQSSQKGGYKHFMLKEIFEQPKVISDCMAGRIDHEQGKVMLTELDALPVPQRLHIVACGTSFHAGMWGRHLIEGLAKIPTDLDIASEFRYRDPLVGPGDMVMVISQSGETADTLAAMRMVKEKGGTVLALCNVLGSSITREASAVIYTQAGPEISVASTKAMCSQMLVITLIALSWAARKNVLPAEETAKYLMGLRGLSVGLEAALPAMCDKASMLARTYSKVHNFFFLGRGHCYPLALEGALKLKEISYIHAEGYAAGEMKHGPIALIDPDFPSFVLALDDKLFPKVKSNIEEVQSRRGKIIALANEGLTLNNVDHVWNVPKAYGPLAAFMALPAMQLFSYEMADYLGKDVDQPRNLAKSVTVE